MTPHQRRHLLVDARAWEAQPSGIGKVIARLLRGLAEAAPGKGWRISAIRHGDSVGDKRFEEDWAQLSKIHLIDSAANRTHHPEGDWQQQAEFPRLVEKIGADAMLSLAFLGPLFGVRALKAVLMHDDLVWSASDSYPLKFRLYFQSMVRLNLRFNHVIYFVSKDVRRRFHHRFSISERRTAVLPNTYDPQIHHRIANGARHNYFLAILSAEKRKNREVLFRAVSRSPGMRFICAGPPDSLGCHCGVEFRENLSDEELAALIRGAAALVAPSMQEGFDLPVLEAVACGTPVIASDIPIHREVAGEGAIYFPSHDSEALSKIFQSWPNQTQRSIVQDLSNFRPIKVAEELLTDLDRRLIAGNS